MMAHLLHMELVRLSWLRQKSSLPLNGDHHQSFFSNQHFSSSPIFCLNSNAQPDSQARTKRYARATKQDAQLRKDLQLFLSSQGLPLDKVPSTKELSNRGREDLAKRVRRRGYKAIQALLADSDLEPGTALVSNTVLKVEDSVRDAPETTPLTASPIDEQLLITCGAPSGTGQVVESSLGKDSTVLQEGIKSETALKATMLLNESLIEKQAEEKLRMRAAEFVRTGRFEQVPDSDEEDEDDDAELLEDSSDEEENVDLQDGQITAEDIAVEKAAKLRAKLLPFLNNASGQPPKRVVELIFDSLQKLQMSEGDQASSRIGSGPTSETDLELQKIKSALISKEKELSEVSLDLVETKAQLALVQAKATAEVAQAKHLALEKDIRLKSADLVLANLKQVQVEYWGEGRRVELAGSFNGWKYFISMEPDTTSEIIKPDGSSWSSGRSRMRREIHPPMVWKRQVWEQDLLHGAIFPPCLETCARSRVTHLVGPMMWETELWLYPGVYEIKFIVDGNWQIDQRREMVMGNSLYNNLLRVEP